MAEAVPSNDRCSIRNCAPWLVLALFLALCAPLFVCMPLNNDTVLFDLFARLILGGGIFYRDIDETNFPGMVWLHILIRSAVGWSSEALRVVDVVVYSAVAAMLARWLPGDKSSWARRGWLALALFAFYFSTSENTHCQRDMWILLPTLTALWLRRQQLERMANGDGDGSFIRGLFEGACWALGVWIKPFVFLTAFAVWLFGLVLAFRRCDRPALSIRTNTLGLLAAGLLIGGLGLAWLWHSGAWPWFWECMLVTNPTYSARFGFVDKLRFLVLLAIVFAPWSLLHLAAVPLAIAGSVRGLSRASNNPSARARALLSFFYLAVLIQACFIQQPYDYVVAPAFVLGIAVIGCAQIMRQPGPVVQVALLVAAALVALIHPMLRPARMALWPRCLAQGSTPAISDELSMMAGLYRITWQDLDKVAEFLAEKNIGEGELTCYSQTAVPLYLRFEKSRSTRFPSFNRRLLLFPEKQEEWVRALEKSNQRFVVVDVASRQAVHQTLLRGQSKQAARALAKCFPWNQGKPIFQSGRYRVYRVTRSVRSLWPNGNKSLK